ncbi:MAG: hypothetical protein KME11_00080 [Timaviella obliquedivisa GSE-PSE-MK23-08B]|jgi:hypothetical protein|nr:hypothetical protein [Timaviella obliquedivisa GSE-PSE-MK23-08B]
MQSTQSNQAFPQVYSDSSVTSKAASTGLSEGKGMERSFAIACGLGAVTVVFGITALIYQFAPEFNRLRNASGQGEVPKFSTFQG